MTEIKNDSDPFSSNLVDIEGPSEGRNDAPIEVDIVGKRPAAPQIVWGQPTGVCMATTFDDPAYYEYEAASSRGGASFWEVYADLVENGDHVITAGSQSKSIYESAHGKFSPGGWFKEGLAGVLAETLLVGGAKTMRRRELARAADMERRRAKVVAECQGSGS